MSLNKEVVSIASNEIWQYMVEEHNIDVDLEDIEHILNNVLRRSLEAWEERAQVI